MAIYKSSRHVVKKYRLDLRLDVITNGKLLLSDPPRPHHYTRKKHDVSLQRKLMILHNHHELPTSDEYTGTLFYTTLGLGSRAQSSRAFVCGGVGVLVVLVGIWTYLRLL